MSNVKVGKIIDIHIVKLTNCYLNCISKYFIWNSFQCHLRTEKNARSERCVDDSLGWPRRSGHMAFSKHNFRNQRSVCHTCETLVTFQAHLQKSVLILHFLICNAIIRIDLHAFNLIFPWIVEGHTSYGTNIWIDYTANIFFPAWYQYYKETGRNNLEFGRFQLFFWLFDVW